MKLMSRKSKFERVLETLENQQMLKAAARHAVESAVAGATNPEQGRRAGEKFESFDLRKMAGPVKTGHGPLRIASNPGDGGQRCGLVAAEAGKLRFMRITSLLMLGIGYVLGSRAGRERYDELAEMVQRASQRLEQQR